MTAPGTLFLVATPIGNLDDMSQRAINTLQEVSFILAEDTRHSQRLLTHFNIERPLQAFHAHNEEAASQKYIDKLIAGNNIALISDAGSPLISDPGYPLVRLARKENIPVRVIPGPCALISALSASGLPATPFIFEGFLKTKQIARQKQLAELQSEHRTTIFYEAPHRIKRCIEDIEAILPDRLITLAKEISKKFETYITGTSRDILTWLEKAPENEKGEFVLVIEGSKLQKQAQEALKILPKLLSYLPIKSASKLCAELIEIDAKTAYKLALNIKNSE